MGTNAEPVIQVRNLNLSYAGYIVMRNLNFSVHKGDIFIIMGVSGCGKSTLLKALIGLHEPDSGQVLYQGRSFWDEPENQQQSIMRHFGVLYQGGALWSSLTVGENIALPLEMYSKLSPEQIRQVVELKLSLVGLAGYADFYPSEISGGMCKRAGLARALALEPEIVFFDEPAAGLDPVNAQMLDELIVQLRDTLGSTVVVVTHELTSILSVGTNSVFLDSDTKTIIAAGDPKYLLDNCRNQQVIRFLNRGKTQGADA